MTIRTISRAEMARADAEFDGLIRDFQDKQAPQAEPNPMHYFVYKALWAKAHGADAVVVQD